MPHGSPAPEAAPGRPHADLAPDLTAGGTRPAPASGDFEAAYRGTPPWDIGRPQPAFLHLAQTGRLQGRVLDVGCGTGEHALLAASLGLEATGLDAAPTAISRAQGKAHERHLAARFVVGDALELAALGERFDTVLDCGLFHVFADAERARFVDSLATVVVPQGHYYLLCFSEQQPGDWGPRRVSQAEIRASFAAGWRVEAIERATLEVTFGAARPGWRRSAGSEPRSPEGGALRRGGGRCRSPVSGGTGRVRSYSGARQSSPPWPRRLHSASRDSTKGDQGTSAILVHSQDKTVFHTVQKGG